MHISDLIVLMLFWPGGTQEFPGVAHLITTIGVSVWCPVDKKVIMFAKCTPNQSFGCSVHIVKFDCPVVKKVIMFVKHPPNLSVNCSVHIVQMR